MNITLMIGNGFDINLGLKTSYHSFLQYYRQPTPSDTPTICRFKEMIDRNLDKWSDVELALGECTQHFTGEHGSDEFFECYDDIFDSLARYLAHAEQRLNSCSPEVLREGMLHALNTWEQGFRTQRKARIDQALIQHSGGYHFNFLVFNYTRTLDRCLAALTHPRKTGIRMHNGTTYANSVEQVVHVHGFTDRDMILGVNDRSQIADDNVFANRLIFDTDRLIKIAANRLYEENTDETAHQILRESHLLYVYGMSLGDTDQLWWQRVEELMHQRPTLHVIIYSHNAPQDQLHYARFLQHENQIQLRLLNFFRDPPKDIMERIHVTGYNIFSKLKDVAES